MHVCVRYVCGVHVCAYAYVCDCVCNIYDVYVCVYLPTKILRKVC